MRRCAAACVCVCLSARSCNLHASVVGSVDVNSLLFGALCCILQTGSIVAVRLRSPRHFEALQLLLSAKFDGGCGTCAARAPHRKFHRQLEPNCSEENGILRLRNDDKPRREASSEKHLPKELHALFSPLESTKSATSGNVEEKVTLERPLCSVLLSGSLSCLLQP